MLDGATFWWGINNVRAGLLEPVVKVSKIVVSHIILLFNKFVKIVSSTLIIIKVVLWRGLLCGGEVF